MFEIKRIMTQIGSFGFHLVAFATFIVLSPLLYVLMLFDSRRLKETARSIEPMPAETASGGAINWFLRHVVGNVIITLTLPLIVLLGGFLSLFFPDHDEDDVIW